MDAGRYARAGAAVIVGGLMLASCGMTGALGDDDAGEQTATIAVVIPVGSREDDGAGVLPAVELAINRTVKDLGRWTVEVVPVTEGDHPQETAAALEPLIDDDLVAVVGGLSTATVRAIQPVLDEASVILVSPADVDPIHTRGANPDTPIRPYQSYFRTAVSATSATGLLAQYAVTDLDVHSVAVIDGGNADVGHQFARALNRDGGRVAVNTSIANGVANAVRSARQANADAVFVTGPPRVGIAVAKEMRRAAFDGRLLGTSALGGEFADDSGQAGDGAVRAIPPELEPTAERTPQSLSADMGGVRLGTYGAASYDAATAIGIALTRCLPPASSARTARAGCTGELTQVDFAGVTGHVAFDDFGDRVGGRGDVETLRDGQWTSATGLDGARH
jgi:ABC-type branched-subunit amino acid transport system substrate-binding protein